MKLINADRSIRRFQYAGLVGDINFTLGTKIKRAMFLFWIMRAISVPRDSVPVNYHVNRGADLPIAKIDCKFCSAQVGQLYMLDERLRGQNLTR